MTGYNFTGNYPLKHALKNVRFFRTMLCQQSCRRREAHRACASGAGVTATICVSKVSAGDYFDIKGNT